MKCIEDEIPFEVPEGWAWSRISTLASIVTDGEHKTPSRCDNYVGYYLLSARNIQDGYIALNNVDFVDKQEFKRISQRCNPQKNDLLISCSGSVGRIAVVDDENKYVMVRSAAMIRFIYVKPCFAMYVLQSPELQRQILQSSKQTAQANIFQGAICSLLVPIAPINEQERIVKIVFDAIQITNQISKEKSDINICISLIKRKLLDLSIRGKLVPQNPDDEPASILLEHIREEKEKLIKAGKIKRDKNESIIFLGADSSYYEKFADGTIKNIDEEIPFEIPDTWEWTRLSAIIINRDNERKPISISHRTNTEKKYDYYGASGIIDKIDKYIFDEKLLLIGEDGANLITRSKPIAFFAEGKYWVNNHAHCIDATDKFILEYLCFYINAINLEKYVTGSAQPKMTQNNMNSILISLPPLNEQQKICEIIDNMTKLLSDLEKLTH